MLRDQHGREHRAVVEAGGQVKVGGLAFPVRDAVDGSVHLQGAHAARAWSVASGGTSWVFLDGEVFVFAIETSSTTQRKRRSSAHAGSLTAPMPATVRKVAVKPGDPVRQGEVLIVLEAMKMELPVRAPAAGTVRAVRCEEGELVEAGRTLVEVDP